MIMFMTLDGVAEFPVYEGVEDDGSDDPMWTHRMDSIDTILLGANSYRKWSAFWPTRKDDPDASPWQKEFSRFADRAEKVVFSKSLASAEWKYSRVYRGDPADEVSRIKSLPGKDIALGGGPRLAQSFLDLGLVDEMLLEIFPSIVGRGKPMFKVDANPENTEDMVKVGAPGRRDFRLLETRKLKDGTLFVHLEKVQPTG